MIASNYGGLMSPDADFELEEGDYIIKADAVKYVGEKVLTDILMDAHWGLAEPAEVLDEVEIASERAESDSEDSEDAPVSDEEDDSEEGEGELSSESKAPSVEMVGDKLVIEIDISEFDWV